MIKVSLASCSVQQSSTSSGVNVSVAEVGGVGGVSLSASLHAVGVGLGHVGVQLRVQVTFGLGHVGVQLVVQLLTGHSRSATAPPTTTPSPSKAAAAPHPPTAWREHGRVRLLPGSGVKIRVRVPVSPTSDQSSSSCSSTREGSTVACSPPCCQAADGAAASQGEAGGAPLGWVRGQNKGEWTERRRGHGVTAITHL